MYVYKSISSFMLCSFGISTEASGIDSTKQVTVRMRSSPFYWLPLLFVLLFCPN